MVFSYFGLRASLTSFPTLGGKGVGGVSVPYNKHSANTELRDHTNGWTALHHAARQLQPQVVKTLIDNGAAITAVDRFGRLPLHLVYRPNNGFSDRSIVVAESGAGVRIRLSVK